MPERSRIVTYFRVSTDEQGESGAGLAAQAAKVRDASRLKGWSVVDTCTDVASGKSTRKRPELARALSILAGGEADLLVVAKLDRLSRSMVDFAQLLARAHEEGWGIVALDLDVDTSTPNGELVANIIMSLAQWERRIISERTTDALAQVKARGTKLGRPKTIDPATERLIKMLHADGKAYSAIAKRLNQEGIPTAQGGRWHASTVRLIVTRPAA